MRCIWMAAALILAMDAGTALAADCKAGSQQTVTGTMGEPLIQDGNWVMAPLDETKPCNVDSVQGKGRAPAGCSMGKRFTAAGTVRVDLGMAGLVVKSIQCSP